MAAVFLVQESASGAPAALPISILHQVISYDNKLYRQGAVFNFPNRIVSLAVKLKKFILDYSACFLYTVDLFATYINQSY